MGLFGPRYIFTDGTSDWIFDTFAWALENFGTDYFYQHTQLVLPTDEFFPEVLNGKDDIAESLFTQVRKHAGMEEWPCDLVAQEEDTDARVGPALLVQGVPSGPAGTFAMVPGDKAPTIEITYNPSQLSRPEALIATFAHELAHYLMHSVDSQPPGGEEYEEHATDLVAVFMGFGIFLANSVFNFSQFTGIGTQGWRTVGQGYLTETEMVFALAVFCQLKKIDYRNVQPFLDKGMRKTLKTASKEMKHHVKDFENLRGMSSNKIAHPAM